MSTDESDRPLYQQLRNHLKRDLAKGTWKPGDALPTESELSRRFNLSGGTVRQAILALVREGLLTRRAGKGTFVARMDPTQGFERFFLFRSDESGGDFRPEIKVLDVRVVKPADQDVIENLELTKTDRVLVARRLLTQNGTPVCWHMSYMAYSLVPGLEHEDLTQQLYPTLATKFGLHIVRAEEFLRAVQADAETALPLDIEAGGPVILVERTAYTYDDKIVEYRKTYGRSDKFLYRIQLP